MLVPSDAMQYTHFSFGQVNYHVITILASDTRSNATATNATADINWSEDFYFDGGVCRPECGEWEEFSSSTVNTIDALIILVEIIDVLASTAVLVLSCIEYKRM